MNAYSNDLRQKAIELYETDNYSKTKISELLKISYKTIWDWIKRYQNSGSYEAIKPKRIGRLRSFDDKDLVLNFLKRNPDASGKEMQDALAPHISDTAFYNSLARMGITYKKKRSNTKSVVNREELNLLIK